VTKKQILLISYVFPPYYGIGGRRWAKHAEALTKLGYTIHVICAKNPFSEESLWTNEIKNNPNIILHQVARMFPKVFVKFEHTFFQKILYKFWIMVLPIITKGSYFDRSVFWKNTMHAKAKELIKKHRIQHVICSGAPFGAMYQTTLLKKMFSNIFVLNDMRDPWTWGPNWGFAGLSEKRADHEKMRERLTIENSDVITAPNSAMLDHLRAKYSQFKNKIIEIPHFFDPNEITVAEKTKSDKIRLVYYGNIYEGIENFIEKAAVFLAEHKDKFEFHIYTDKDRHKVFFEKHGADNVKTFPQENATTLFKKFKDYDFVFIMTPDYGKNNVSTKFFEIAYTQTPIIIFSNPGFAGEYIEQNGLGIYTNENTLEAKMLDLYYTRNFKFNTAFDLSQYSLDNIGRKIDEILTNGAKTK
jgi:glycosyltransferase involved in cell wall biosynthesis